MREIKFRAWELFGHGQWVYGYLSRKWDNWFITDDNGSATLIDIDSVGECTSLTDKNGVEIYEGDILSHPIQGERKIYYPFDERTASFGMENIHNGMKSDLCNGFLYEIIGNIYKNPELLEVSK